MYTILFFAILLFSAIFHEYMHALAADSMGDPTPRDMGRLTLNPLAHIDPVMTLALPALMLWASGGQFMFAAAKPVPFNPYNLQYPKYARKYGSALVGLAGPFANLMLAVIFALVIRLAPLPLPVATGVALVVFVNVLLMIFNLVPLPPLDGSHLLLSLIPASWYKVEDFLQRYGWWLLIIFIFFFAQILSPIMFGFTHFLIGDTGLNALAVAFGGE